MEALMKTKLAQIGLFFSIGLFAVSCASEPKNYRIELIDQPTQQMVEEEEIDTYEQFPYIDWRGAERR